MKATLECLEPSAWGFAEVSIAVFSFIISFLWSVHAARTGFKFAVARGVVEFIFVPAQREHFLVHGEKLGIGAIDGIEQAAGLAEKKIGAFVVALVNVEDGFGNAGLGHGNACEMEG